jgi:hypothetical protein
MSISEVALLASRTPTQIVACRIVYGRQNRPAVGTTRLRVFIRLRILASWIALALSASSYLVAQGEPVTVVPLSHNFGEHDVGTTDKFTFKIQNVGTARATSLRVRVVAPRNDYYLDQNECADTLDLHETCNLQVAFSPVEVKTEPTKGAEKESQDKSDGEKICAAEKPCLAISYAIPNGTHTVYASLIGSGYLPDLFISPLQIDFAAQRVLTTSAARIVTVINPRGGSSTRNISTQTSSGDFLLLSPSCSPLGPGEACNLMLNFAPQRKGLVEGVLIITSDGKDGHPHQVRLAGKAIECWDGRHCIPKRLDLLGTVLVALLYWFGMVVVRWNRVARPTRQLLAAQIDSSEAQLSSPPVPQTDPAVEQIQALFKSARGLIASGTTQIGDFLFWSRGHEITGWGYVHEAEIQMSRLLSDETVKARLETAQEQLAARNTPGSLALTSRIQQALSGAPPASSERCKALLAEALVANYDATDSSFADLVSWQNKTAWLVVIGLMLIVALSASLGHAVLFLIGGTGGLLSRLSRSLYRKDVPTDYGASWTTLFLSPVVGALGGWTGILLSTVAIKVGVLGTLFSVNWDSPYDPMTLGIALLFGVSERAFDSVLDKLEEKVAEPTSSAQQTPKSVLKITTNSDLPAGTAGQDYRAELKTSGATGTVTWTKTDGSLPDGVTMDAAGVISGKLSATTSGKTFTFTVEVKDSTSTQHQTFNIKIN